MRLPSFVRAALALIATGVVVTAMTLSLAQVFGLFRVVPVLSGSMSGYVEAGDAAILRPVATSELGVGDVIAYYPPVPDAPLTLHRIVQAEVTDNAMVVRTQGDANSVVDPWIAQLQGSRAWRANGVLLAGLAGPVLRLQAPLVRVVLLGVTMAVLLYAALRRIWTIDDLDPEESAADPTPTAATRRAVILARRRLVFVTLLRGTAVGLLLALLFGALWWGAFATVTVALAGYAVVLRRMKEIERSAPGSAAWKELTLPVAGAIATVVSVAAVSLTAQPAMAGFTADARAEQHVSTATVEPPTGPEAALACDLGVPTGVRITWTASASSSVTGYQVERGATADGAFAPVGTTDAATTEFVDQAIDAVRAGETWYRVRGLSDTWESAPTEPVSLLALCPVGDVAAEVPL